MKFTIGEYSREMILSILDWIKQEEQKEKQQEEHKQEQLGRNLSFYFGEEIEEKQYNKKLKYLINEIGEYVYKQELLDRLEEVNHD